MEDDEWKKLPLDERCVHKLWKARVNGYEEAKKLFEQIDDEKSPEFGKYIGLIKKFVTDSNAVSQEKGLEAALVYVENYAHAGKTVGEVMAGVVSKCIAAPKTRTRQLAAQIILMYIEIEKHEAVLEELIKGMDQKNPKIVAACISTVTAALHEFGGKVINMKPLVKKIAVLFGDRDKGVRDEARLMVVEIYRWVGPTLRSQLNSLQPVQITELEAEFQKVQDEAQKAQPTRYLRSQQKKQAKIVAEAAEAEEDDVEEDRDDAAGQIDPEELLDPVDILSKLPKNFYEQIESKKWQERKEALESLEALVKSPKLESGDYGDVVRALKKIIQKDTNVMVIALAGKCLAQLANGLKKRFHIYASACISALLEKFKEKKQNVVVAMREAIDAVYLSISIEAILEDVLEALNNKNPAVKAETASFLTRSFSKTQPTALNKKLLKAYTTALIKNANEPDPNVRDCSFEALGTLMKLVGEKAISPFIAELEKDNLKMTKIKECCDKAVISVKLPSKKEKAAVASVKTAPTPQKTQSAPAKNVPKSIKSGKAGRRPASAAISSGTATIVKSRSTKTVVEKPREKELSDEEVDEIVAGILKPEIVSGLCDSNWKNRLSAVEEFCTQVQMLDASSLPTQALVRTLMKKPGLKDTNFQVLKGRLEAIKYLARNGQFSITTADLCINEITEKLADAKNKVPAAEALTAITESVKLDHVTNVITDFALSQKNPKVLQEALNWLSNAIKEFGFGNVNAKCVIETSKKALASTNPTVRTAAISLLGILYLYMGATLYMFFENEKPALRDQISAEFSKYDGQKAPTPTKGIKKSASADVLGQEEDEDVAAADSNDVNLQDLLPRVDISSQITEALLEEMADKDWKVRIEALTKISGIISEAKLIKPNIGDLPQALALRLVDSNTKIAQTSLNICEMIATAMGPPCKHFIRTLLPGFMQGLGDSKHWMRAASVSCLNSYGELCGYKEFFEGEVIADALKTGSPTLRSELWMWLADKLPKIKSVPKEEIMACIPYLYANLEDRNADVRKNAQDAVLGLMIHVGYDAMFKQTDKLKPSSKPPVVAALDKARPNLPVKPLPKSRSTIAPGAAGDGDGSEEKTVKGGKAPGSTKAARPKSTSKLPSVRKKEEDVDTSPLMVENSLKSQRMIDESKLKVLKWNFTTPREEFVELLKEQMTTANVNRNLMANMFHSDFRYHIKALESLMEDLVENWASLIANLDLVLKWLTLRFFDTNPSVLLKGLEYLHSVFNVLIENKYKMSESEAASFIPYLVLKAGDPKDAVRNGVKSLYRQICFIYSVSKLFSYIMEGLKSKNARQRTECLEVMGSIIADYGIGVCLPSPGVCLKEVAKQISDRDNAVRNAALNCIVQAYFVVDEKIFKLVGHISDKEMSLLEERIKRAKRPPPKPSMGPGIQHGSPQHIKTEVMSPTQPSVANMTVVTNGRDTDEDDEEDEIPNVILPTELPHELMEYSGPFQLDPEFMRRLDSIDCSGPSVEEVLKKIEKFDLSFMNEDIVFPPKSSANVALMVTPKKITLNDTLSPSVVRALFLEGKASRDPVLEKIISDMASPNLDIAIKASQQVLEYLQSNKSSTIADYQNEFLGAVTTQLRMLHRQDPQADESVVTTYRVLLTAIDMFYQHPPLGNKASAEVIRNLVWQLINLLVETKLESCPNGESYMRVINLHCIKIIEHSHHTNTICALVQLLHECVHNDVTAHSTNLVMKCLWRLIKCMPPWADEIDYDSVLYELHCFFKDFPSLWWKGKTDTPLRTIKTILHSMAKMRGAELMSHLGKIPNTAESELESYILRLLKSLKIEEVKEIKVKSVLKMEEKEVPVKSKSPKVSRAVHTAVCEVIEKIGKKTDGKEGLLQLHNLLQEHPDIDVNRYLVDANDLLKNFIRNGLKDIDTSKTNQVAEKMDVTVVKEEACGDNERGTDFYFEELQKWRRVWDETMLKYNMPPTWSSD